METASEENKSSTVGGEINKMKEERISGDRISDLPVELLHRIFSLLPFKSIVRTVILSKHWNHLSLWRSHPHLDFSHLSRNHMAMDLIPTVLSRRQPDFNITTFRLSGDVSAPCLKDCIHRVMKQRIEQLELDVDTGCCFDLPTSLFYCNTLRVLELNIGVKSNMSRYGYPSPVPSPVLFSSRNLPLLRKLCLKDCRGTHDLNINIPGLEILKLEGLRLKGLDISGTGLLELQVTRCLRLKSWAKIIAPNLRRLYWEDNFNVKCVTESFEDLNTGSVCFPCNPPNPATLQSAAAFISALCFARSLSVRSQVLKDTHFQFGKVLKANVLFCQSCTFYLTFQARDTITRVCENFQAKVHIFMKDTPDVLLVRLEARSSVNLVPDPVLGSMEALRTRSRSHS